MSDPTNNDAKSATKLAEPGVSRWVRVILILSLTANLLILGLVAGAMFGKDRDERRGAALSDIGFGPFLSALPRDEQRALGRDLVERSGPLRRNRDEIRQQFDDLLAALRAEPFDIDALKSAVDAQQMRLRDRQEIGKEVLYQRIEAMSDADRSAFADRLEQRIRRGPPDRKR